MVLPLNGFPTTLALRRNLGNCGGVGGGCRQAYTTVMIAHSTSAMSHLRWVNQVQKRVDDVC